MLVFKTLYKNSAREQGNLWYFREKLQCKNALQDVKQHENCKQLFTSAGKCFTIEAMFKFFEIKNTKGQIVKNSPPYQILDLGSHKNKYFPFMLRINSLLSSFFYPTFLPPNMMTTS